MNEIITKLNIIRQIEQQYNDDLPNPIDPLSIEKFKLSYKNIFQQDIDDELLDFFKICDGLDFNGYQIYSSNNHTINKVEYGIFQNNELWYDLEDFKKYIFFAESGSELFVFDKEQKEYQCLDRYNTDNIIQEFSSFDDMLLYILKLMLYEDVD